MANRTGQQLGHYRLIRLLGEGGFAEVYLGEHIHLGSKAAIKVLHSQLTSDDTDKFLVEARNLVGLIHPNIVRVLDFGIEEKTPFLVMDYAPNGTLRQLHPRGVALPLATIVAYVKQIADGLQFAHDEKLIHRDIKPENMLIGRRNEILLSDFGIAIVAQSSRYQSRQDMAGTIAYMAPEQIQAHPRPASDQYSLAVVVYEWLTGDRPFHGGFSEIAIKHTVVPPPPLREKIPNISPDMEQIVLTALAKEPKERFGSVQAFARALEQASQSDHSSQLAPTIVVKLPVPAVQSPSPVIPSNPSITPITPPLAPTEPAAISKPVGTILHTYRGHSGRVNVVAWSPDSKRIASCGDDKTVQIWNAITGDKTSICTGHSKQVNAVTWSPDGLRIVSGSSDAIVQVWETSVGNKIITYRGHTKGVNSVVWSPNRQFIASAGEDKEVQVWDATRGFHVLTYRGHSHIVTDLSWSPNGLFLASTGNNSEVQVWNAASGLRVFSYVNHSNWVNAISYSPDGTRIASAGDDMTVQVRNVTSGRNISSFGGHAGRIFAVVWSPDGKYVASGSLDGTVKIWFTSNGGNIYTYSGHSSKVGAVAWSPNGKYIASGSWDGTVHVWVAP